VIYDEPQVIGFYPGPLYMGFAVDVTLRRFSVRVFQFSPVVSFHQCSILIHSSITRSVSS